MQSLRRAGLRQTSFTAIQANDQTKAAASMFEGFVDLVDAASVQGWAWCPATPTVRPTVMLIDEAFTVLAKAVAGQFRPDVAAAGHHDGCYGFRIDLADIQDSRRELRALVVVEPTWQPLCKELLRITVPHDTVRGNLDILRDEELQGWYRPGDALWPARVVIGVDGREEASAMADQYRPDLEAAGLGHGKWGFSWPVPRHLCDGEEHTFTARTPNGLPLGQPLRGRTAAWRYSPYVGQCEPIAKHYDAARGWLCLFQGTVRRIDDLNASVPLAVQADDDLLAIAFSDPDAGGVFRIPVPRDALLAKGLQSRLSVVVHGENFALPDLDGTVADLVSRE
ncbi:hypothetical protein [Solidesulfovibrio sp.]|uniref:hypothetical protein n=2 Tax=Solidesulfovibrio sp. TaxID=2910990 RepID=UPI002B1F4862|nr:hypothetical protein [Solidesulfovibrio sp.]MEA4855631.1 hypothetical protein [Solidesulfovibrio sp.]